jgi:hypothetical protein
MEQTNFTVYIGKQKRWVEIRPLGRNGEYLVYSNDKRNPIGELRQEANQNHSILGTFIHVLETGAYRFEGKTMLAEDELRDIALSIQAN